MDPNRGFGRIIGQCHPRIVKIGLRQFNRAGHNTDHINALLWHGFLTGKGTQVLNDTGHPVGHLGNPRQIFGGTLGFVAGHELHGVFRK